MGKLQEVTPEIIKEHHPWIHDVTIADLSADFQYYAFVPMPGQEKEVFMLYSDEYARKTKRIIPCTVCNVDVFMDGPLEDVPDCHTCEDGACITYWQKQQGGVN